MTEATIQLWFDQTSQTPDYLMKVWAPAPGIDDLILLAMLLAQRNYVRSATVQLLGGESRTSLLALMFCFLVWIRLTIN